MAKRSGRPSAAQTSAPKSDKIKGSNTNKKGSATSKGASSIKLSGKTISALKNKLDEFKNKYPNKDNVSLSDLKAVYRRGSGAFSGSHRPNISRAGWSYARTNKFLEKAAGKKVKAAYVQDDDLLKYEKGGIVKNEQFYNWYLNWYKNDVEGMSIMFTLPSEFTRISDTSENDIILDVFEKTNESVNANKYLQEIIDNADKYGVTIYVHPIPKTHKLKPEEYNSKITKDYLISYYENFGFVLDSNRFFMVKKPKGNYKDGGKVGEEITCSNCGWKWNTADSKGKDKYTCHKCGTYLKRGGQLDPDNKRTKDYYAHKSGNAGGMLVGKRHSEGGIKAVNKSTGQPLEMEGGETVITRNAVSDNTKREFEGEMLTNRQILSKINVSGGGVSFAEGGDVPHKCACSGKQYKYGGKLLPDYHIVDILGGQHEYFDNLLPSEAFNKMFDFTPKFEEGGTIYEDGGMIRLVSKKVPSLQEYISKNFGISKGLEKKTYKNYLFSTYSIVFDKLPTMVKNGLLMGNQKLVDKYING